MLCLPPSTNFKDVEYVSTEYSIHTNSYTRPVLVEIERTVPNFDPIQISASSQGGFRLSRSEMSTVVRLPGLKAGAQMEPLQASSHLFSVIFPHQVFPATQKEGDKIFVHRRGIRDTELPL